MIRLITNQSRRRNVMTKDEKELLVMLMELVNELTRFSKACLQEIFPNRQSFVEDFEACVNEYETYSPIPSLEEWKLLSRKIEEKKTQV